MDNEQLTQQDIYNLRVGKTFFPALSAEKKEQFQELLNAKWDELNPTQQNSLNVLAKATLDHLKNPEGLYEPVAMWAAQEVYERIHNNGQDMNLARQEAPYISERELAALKKDTPTENQYVDENKKLIQQEINKLDQATEAPGKELLTWVQAYTQPNATNRTTLHATPFHLHDTIPQSDAGQQAPVMGPGG